MIAELEIFRVLIAGEVHAIKECERLGSIFVHHVSLLMVRSRGSESGFLLLLFLGDKSVEPTSTEKNVRFMNQAFVQHVVLLILVILAGH